MPYAHCSNSEAAFAIAENLAALLAQRGDFKVIDHTVAVFGEHYEQVRDLVVRKAVQELHKQGRTASDGRGGRPRELRVTQPPRRD